MKLFLSLIFVLFSINSVAATGFSYFCIDKKDLEQNKLKDIDVSESNFTLHVETEDGFEKATYIQGDDNFDMDLLTKTKTSLGASFVFTDSNNRMAFLKERRALYGNNKVDAFAHVLIDGASVKYGCFVQ